MAVPNDAEVRMPDGTIVKVPKATRCVIPPGGVLVMSTGGGGGYGPPDERPREAVARDLREGYISDEFARRHYPHAL